MKLRLVATWSTVAMLIACSGNPPVTAPSTAPPATLPSTPSPAPTTPPITPAPTPTFTIGDVPSPRGYHQLVTAGGLGTVLLGGFMIRGITLEQPGPEADKPHPGRVPDGVWTFAADEGWRYGGPPDTILATNQIDEAVFDSARQQIVAHLAVHAAPATAVFDAGTGTLTATGGDGVRDTLGPLMAYDEESDRVIVFGGSGPFQTRTSAFDPAADAWTLMPRAVSPPYSQRAYGAMAYDPISDRVILFGGLSGEDVGPDTEAGGTWAYDYNSNTWMDLKPTTNPGPRVYTSMVYEPTTQRFILFGGLRDVKEAEPPEPGWYPDGLFSYWDQPLGDTWAYDPAANEWSELAPAISPSPRAWHDLALDPTSGLIVLFGGGPARYDFTNETWLFDPATSTWSEWSQ